MSKRLLKFVSLMVAAATIMGCCSFSAGADSTASTDSYHDDWLHVEGNKICDMNGNEVWITGCNWFGFNVGSQVFDGVWSQNMHSMLTQIADHGFNYLRVPVSTQILLQWKNDDPDPAEPKVNIYTNPELKGMNSKQLFNQAVTWCRELGIKIMIDVHSAPTHAAGHTFALWYAEGYTTEDLYSGLEWFTGEYKDDDTIVGIDIKNEPHGTADTPTNMAKWDGSNDPNNWKMVAETAGKKILAINPNMLIIVEGVEVYPKEGYDYTAPKIDYTTMTTFYYNTWWGANLRGVRKNPINLNESGNSHLVYSAHDYGPLVYKQDWFYDGFNQETLMKDCWYDNWAYINEEGIAPMFIGEWGGFMDGGDNEKWMNCIRDYIIQNKIHHTFWCFNENSGDTGGLVYDNFSTWDEEKYALVEPSLWQDNSGKFISLDHKTALGANGISLSDYYNESPSKILGDLNSDGKVNAFDALLFKRYLTSPVKLTSINNDNADMNSDGTVNSKDLALLNKFLLKK